MKNMKEFFEYFNEKYPGMDETKVETWVLAMAVYYKAHRFNYLHGFIVGFCAAYLFFVLKVYMIIPWHIAG